MWKQIEKKKKEDTPDRVIKVSVQRLSRKKKKRYTQCSTIIQKKKNSGIARKKKKEVQASDTHQS